ncbi:hypothetical protein NKH34_13355 [Mesorhizobium sp. M1148]|uniref:hypothetical protein n=1 Tax=unclassified Mesorhizobium TaxID=325217 RepID=UPI0003CED3CA|nr:MULTISPECIES: hypothetical protein [unclassified Mesorhizobium]ESX90880.1 hypothetical protein X756_02335 [Mesorhizobium sp. LSHC412B00]ESZ61638.1 hypothetical protein X729_12520 [Mesorhizobium sp. L103C131B0]
MSAHIVYDNAPLGSLIRYSDGTPKPPARFTRKLADWERRNGLGRLVRKAPPRDRPTYSAPAAITLNEGTFSSGGIILVTVMRTHSVDSDLCFKIVEQPSIGMVRVLQQIGDDDELLYLAESREAAALWLAKTGYCNARLEDVTADEVGADVVEGRAAA